MKSPATKRGSRRGGRAARILALSLLLVAATASSVTAEPAWSKEPARSNEGAVQFTLTPRGISGGQFRVDIAVNTHSGNLADLDLAKATELRTGGKTLHPVEAPALRGHHARGRLEFALERVPDTFEIVIRGVRSMGDLTFRWP